MQRSDDEASLRLPAAPGSVPRGRRWVLERARRAGASPVSLGAVELAASEVLTHVVGQSAGTADIVVHVRGGGRQFTVEVGDGGLGAPASSPSSIGMPPGHGLQIVQALTADWGWGARGGGVWFTVRW